MDLLNPPPYQVLRDSWLADAYWRYLVRVGVIKPRKSKRAYWFLGWVGKPAKSGRVNPIAVREMNIVLTHIMKKGQGNKRNPQLCFDLAKWCIQVGKVPKRALKEYYGDVQLFDILLRHGQLPADTVWFDALSAQEKDRLEKRLHHLWPIVGSIVQALQATTTHLRKGKPPSTKKKRIRISRPPPGSAWCMGLSNLGKR